MSHPTTKKNDRILPIPNPPVVTLEEILTLADQDEIALQKHKSKTLAITEGLPDGISPLLRLPKELWHIIICRLVHEFYWSKLKASCKYLYYLARTAPIEFSTANKNFSFDRFIRAHPKARSIGIHRAPKFCLSHLSVLLQLPWVRHIALGRPHDFELTTSWQLPLVTIHPKAPLTKSGNIPSPRSYFPFGTQLVSLTNDGLINDLSVLVHCPSLRKLDTFNFPHIETLTQLETLKLRLPIAGRVPTTNVSTPRDVIIRRVAFLTNLTNLKLKHLSESQHIGLLSNLVGLESLSISNASINDGASFEFFSRLTFLSLSRVTLTNAAEFAHSVSTKLPNLVTLKIKEQVLAYRFGPTQMSESFLASFGASLTKLRALVIRPERYSQAVADDLLLTEHLSSWRNLQQLRVLDLMRFNLTTLDRGNLTVLGELHRLEVLRIHSFVDNTYIPILKKLPRLSVLCLYKCTKLTDEGAVLLASFSSLLRLELCFAPALTDVTLKALTLAPKLIYLNVTGSLGFTDDGDDYFKKRAKYCVYVTGISLQKRSDPPEPRWD